MRWLVLGLILIPAAELAVLMLSGQTIGIMPTLLLILATGIIGAFLAKKQGIQTIRRLQNEMNTGQMPGDTIIDGLCVLVGAILLLTPGFITDLIGFILLVPALRNTVKPAVYRMIRKRMKKGQVIIYR